MQSTSSIKQTLAEPENKSLVIRLLKADPPPSRNALAKELCRSLNLRDSKGHWQMATTSKALRELEAQGLWLLPKPLFSGPRQWNPIRLSQPVPLPTDVPELVQDLRGLRLILVEDQVAGKFCGNAAPPVLPTLAAKTASRSSLVASDTL